MISFSDFLRSQPKAWFVDVIDIKETQTAGPFMAKSIAQNYILAMEGYESVNGKLTCSEPYIEAIGFVEESMDQDEKKKFYDKLQKGKVHFQYYKKDGSLRKAHGTLAAKFLPSPAKSTDTKDSARDKLKRTFPDDSVFYFDLDKKDFRSFKIENFDKYLKD